MKTSRCGRCGQPIPEEPSYICAGCFAHAENYEDWLINLLEEDSVPDTGDESPDIRDDTEMLED